MKKIIASLVAIIMLLTATAFAEDVAWLELELMDMTISAPEDVIGYVSDTFEPDVPFACFYEDYDETRFFNKNVAFTYVYEVMDIYSVDPFEVANYISLSASETLVGMGITAGTPAVIDAAIDTQDGRDALFMYFITDVDYSTIGYNESITLNTVQMIVPIPEKGITYIVTVSTDDMSNSNILFGISDSITWN